MLPVLPLLALLLVPAAQDDGGGEASRSLLTTPLYLSAEPPECRAAAVILVGTEERSAAEARARAAELAERLRAGADFADLARRCSDGPEARRGGVVGTLPPGTLEGPADRFLFSSAPGAVSDPIETERGFCIWRRIERWAAIERVDFDGPPAEHSELAAEVAERARNGEALAALADEHAGECRATAEVLERGREDRFLKLAAFEAELGQVIGPFESPLGTVVARRIQPEDVPPESWEKNWIRARALVVSDGTGSGAERPRDPVEVRRRVQSLYERVVGGETLESLARALTDEPSARARGGDLGWIHRYHPNRARILDRLFTVEPGTVLEPSPIRGGWVILERTR